MSDDETPPAIEPKARLLGLHLTNQVTEHINQKATSPTDNCPVCSSPENIVGPTVYSLTTLPAEGTPFTDQQMPLFATVCMNCGFVRLFSELVLQRFLQAEPANNQTDSVASGD